MRRNGGTGEFWWFIRGDGVVGGGVCGCVGRWLRTLGLARAAASSSAMLHATAAVHHWAVMGIEKAWNQQIQI